MRSGRATVAVVCGGLVILAGLLWWQSAFGGTSLPKGEPETTETADSTKEAGSLKGEAGPKPADTDREKIETQPVETPAAEPTTGSLLLSVVYGDDNTPAAGIGVVVQEVVGQGPRASPRRLTTSNKGSVRVTGLRPGKVYVRTDRQPMKVKTTTVVVGEETRFTLTLEEGVDVHGIVVDTDGVTVADAEIVLTGWAAMEPHVAGRSNDQGRFALRQVPQHSNIGARAPGHAPSPLQTITAGAGAKVEVRIVLPGPGGGVCGRVVDPDGKGVAGTLVKMGLLKRDYAVINLPGGMRGMKPQAVETRTDAEGRFELTGLAPGKTPVLVRAETFAPWVGTVDVVAHVTTPMVIRLERGVTCEGTVYDDQGKPAARVEVDHGEYGAPERRDTRTKDDGTYRLEGLPTGAILVQARGKDRGNASVELNGLPGQTLRWDAKLSRGRQLELVVLDQANNPLPGVVVMAIGPNVKGERPWFGHGTTDKKGSLVLTDCPAGALRVLELRKQEYATLHRFDVDTTVGRIVVQMEYEGKPTARIVGALQDPDGKPVADAMLSPIRRGDMNTRVYTTTAAGKIKIEELRPGSYRLVVQAGGYPSYMSERELLNGETWDVGTVRLVRGARVLVQVTNAAEAAKLVKYVYLSVSTTDLVGVTNINTRQLPLRSEPIAPGRYLLNVGGPKVIPKSIPITVSEGKDTEVQTSIQVGVPGVFEFVLPDGSDKIHRMEMTLLGGGGLRFSRGISRSLPTPFKLRMGLAPGRYTMKASTAQGYRGELEFDVPADGAAAQTLRVKLR